MTPPDDLPFGDPDGDDLDDPMAGGGLGDGERPPDADDAPDPFFGERAGAVSVEVPYDGRWIEVTYRQPSVAEERYLLRWKEQFIPADQLLAESVGRMAFAIVAVAGRPVDAEFPAWEERVEWITGDDETGRTGWDGMLLKAVLLEWEYVRDYPLRFPPDAPTETDVAPAPAGS